MTLVEVLIVSAIMSVLFASLCEIYFSVADNSQRQRGEGEALVACSQACSRLNDYLSNAVTATVITRLSSGDTIAVCLPMDSAYTGLYVPAWTGGKLQYRNGNWLVFYLSDTSGNYSRNGTILWAATMTWAGYPGSVVPDSSWSLYYGQARGRIAPLKSLSFSLTSGTGGTRVTMSAVAAYKAGRSEKQFRLTRTVFLRNSL